MDAFFRLVNLILADQIRGMLAATLADYVQLFFNHPGFFFSVRLNIAENALAYEPALSDFQAQLESIYEQILPSAEKTQKVEFLLFQKRSATLDESKIPNLHINLEFSKTHAAIINEYREKLKEQLGVVLTAPKLYLKEFDRYKAIISGAAETDLRELLASNVSIERQFEEIKRFRREGNQVVFAFNETAQFAHIIIHQEDLIKGVYDRCLSGLVAMIMDKISKDNLEMNQK